MHKKHKRSPIVAPGLVPALANAWTSEVEQRLSGSAIQTRTDQLYQGCHILRPSQISSQIGTCLDNAAVVSTPFTDLRRFAISRLQLRQAGGMRKPSRSLSAPSRRASGPGSEKTSETLFAHLFRSAESQLGILLRLVPTASIIPRGASIFEARLLRSRRSCQGAAQRPTNA